MRHNLKFMLGRVSVGRNDNDGFAVLLHSYNLSPWGAWWLCLSLTLSLHKTQLYHWTVIADKCSYWASLFSSDLLFSNASTSCHFVLPDSCALDTQVKSHCSLPPFWFVIPLHVFCPYFISLVLGFMYSDAVCEFHFFSPFELNK